MSALLDGVTLHNFAAVIEDTAFARDLAAFYGRHLFEGIQGLFGERHASPDLTVLLLPGILGTSLNEGPTDLLWIDPLELGVGGLERLRVKPGATPADDRSPFARDAILAGNPLVFVYGPLFAYLKSVRGYDVRQFGYDWRLSIDDTADRLAKEIVAHDRVVIIGHSMGCLVARRCVQRHPELLDRVAQAIFIAPAMGGSFVPAQVAMEEYWASLLVEDIVGRARVATTLVTCPGFSELLPDDDLFPGSVSRLKSTGVLAKFPEVLASRSRAFSAALRKPEGDALAADLALRGRTSIILTTGRDTVVDVLDSNGKPSFVWKAHGDDTVPTASAWDPKARGHYLSTFSHPIVPLEPAVVLAVGELVASGGASAKSLERRDTIPEAAVPSWIASELGIPSVLTTGRVDEAAIVEAEPVTKSELPARFAANRFTLADLLPPRVAPALPPLETVHGVPETFMTSTSVDVAASLLRALSSSDRWRFARRPEARLADGLVATPALAAWQRDATSTEIPAWCAEVLRSSTDRDVRRLKLPLYARAGVSCVWLVDPERNTIEVFRARDGMPVLVETVGDDPAWRGEPFGVAVGRWWETADAPDGFSATPR